MSKPCLVPSRSIDVSRISPAPSSVIRRAQPMASRPVARRPPWVNTSQRPGPDCLASIATTTHWLPNFSAAWHELGPRDRCRVDRRLVGARQQQAANILDLAHASADGEGHEALLGGAPHDVIERGAVLVGGRDVEEAELVG